jgi:hypothetical protein
MYWNELLLLILLYLRNSNRDAFEDIKGCNTNDVFMAAVLYPMR